MKAFAKVNMFLVVGVLGAILALPLRATTIFDNSVNDLMYRFEPGTNEVGDEIILTNYPARYLTNFSFEFWGTNDANPSAFAGTVQARVRFYQQNGPLFNGYPSPGANFYDSGWFSVAPTPRSTEVFSSTDFCLTGLYLPVISNMTWSVQFQGMGPTDHVGVDVYSPAVVGQDYPDYWENVGGTWNLYTNSSGVPIDFAALMEASTQPVVNPNPCLLTCVKSGTNLLLSWPSDHIGWMLQVQTNVGGLTKNWYTITNSSTNNSWTMPIDRSNPSIVSWFCRLIYP